MSLCELQFSPPIDWIQLGFPSGAMLHCEAELYMHSVHLPFHQNEHCFVIVRNVRALK